MHFNILNEDQQKLLPLLSKFKREYFMVGGTSIALHIGHRMSIDFDLFKNGTIKPKAITKKIQDSKENFRVTLNIDGQLNLSCRNVKFTFFQYEFEILHPINVKDSISIPTLIDLAAMKAYALGRRSKWKDYVDLYFILRDHFSIAEIAERAKHIYKDLFSEKLFRAQLNYFKGINFEEQVDYMPGFETDEHTIKEFLTDAALTGF